VKRKVVHLSVPANTLPEGQPAISAACMGDLVFTSSVPGVDPVSGETPSDPESQFAIAFENLRRLLREAGRGRTLSGLLPFIRRAGRGGRLSTSLGWRCSLTIKIGRHAKPIMRRFQAD
jgi:hypothetical protein